MAFGNYPRSLTTKLYTLTKYTSTICLMVLILFDFSCRSVKIWSKSGKLVASCNVPYTPNNKSQKNKGVNSTTILWYKPDVLLIGDGKSQLLECNPLKIDW